MTDLFDWIPQNENVSAEAKRLSFERFHKENPQVYEMFDRFTRQTIRMGHKRFSAYAIVHRIRWQTSLMTVGCEYKIANNHVPFYSRLWTMNNPEYQGYFQQNTLKHEAA